MGMLARLLSMVRTWNDDEGSAREVAPVPYVPQQLAVEVSAQVRELEGALTNAMATERKLRSDIEDHVATARDWMDRAESAAETYDEPIAAHALEQQRHHQGRARSLEKQRIGHLVIINRLRLQLDEAQAWLKHLQAHRLACPSTPVTRRRDPVGWPARETVH